MPENSSVKISPVSLHFEDAQLEKEFRYSYDKSVKIPLRVGIVISLLSWYSGIFLVFSVIPEKAYWLTPLTLFYIGSYFGFIIFATYKEKFLGYYHILGAISNAWAGLFAIYFCDQFPNGVHLTLPVLIFIIFFGSYMVRLRWIAGFIAALSYIAAYHIYIAFYSDLSTDQVILYSFVAWMTLIFAAMAGRMAETNNRVNYIQRRTIKEQSAIIEGEKEVLLKEVHHRVKNNLQVIVSLINLQLSKIENSETAIELKDTQSRVLSMSLAHQWVRQNSNFTRINLKDYVHNLIENIFNLYHERDPEFELDIPEHIDVEIEMAIPFGLILNEIVVDFYKKSLKHHPAKFDLKISPSPEGFCLLEYRNNLPIEKVDEENLSIELIQSLVDQIDGKLKKNSDLDNSLTIDLRF
jgi:two-component sensor histidine kinase